MASRVGLPPLPNWLSALPLLFTRATANDEDQALNSALAAASAVLAADLDRRGSRSRICFLIIELAAQFGRRTGDWDRPIPVTRSQIARASQLDLTRVKRILGFLALSQVIEETAAGLRIVDWQRLCKLASYERSWVTLPLSEEEENGVLLIPPPRPETVALTVSGDQASFV